MILFEKHTLPRGKCRNARLFLSVDGVIDTQRVEEMK